MTASSPTTFGDILRHRAHKSPHAPAFRYLDSLGAERGQLTYAELVSAAERVAAQLAARTVPGDRVAILAPPGLDYVVAIFACFFAGVVAVPAYPPRQRRADPRVTHLLHDAGATVALVPSAEGGLTLSDTGVGAVTPAHDVPAGLALLQYTSGSTRDPRGVMLTHAQLLAHAELLQEAVPHAAGETAVFWIPPYHDMGLMGAILQAVYTGVCSVLMPPAAFLQKPLAWLEAMSRYRAVSSAAPDSAYRECVARARAARRAGAGDGAVERAAWDALELSNWRIAFNGAEPIHGDTIKAFTSEFGANGFKRSAFVPSYGLAEATLFAAGGFLADEPTDDRTDDSTDDRVPASAPVAPRTTVCLVDPTTGHPVADGVEGEIWMRGPQVAAGYWNAPAATGDTFGARLAGHSDPGPWLRTGDLGIRYRGAIDGPPDGLLEVTGRLKDLLIVAGRNVHPQDVEHAAESAHDAIRRGGTVAVQDGDGRVLLLAEVQRDRSADAAQAIVAAVQAAVADDVALRVDEVVLVPARALPRTSSGKRQRRAAMEAWRAGALPVLHAAASTRFGEGADLLPWLCAWIAAEVEVPVETIRGDRSLADNGLDSIAVIRLHAALEAQAGVTIAQAALWNAPTLDALARTLTHSDGVRPSGTSLADEIAAFTARRASLEQQGNPFFLALSPTDSPVHVEVEGERLLSFASYDYLGLSAHPRVREAAAQAARSLGTSASASRLIGGERAVHGQLERALAGLAGTEAALTFTSGHATNVSVIAQLVGPGDVICCDARLHNSGWLGARHSGARVEPFRHNDLRALEALLAEQRGRHRRALVLVEGLYSADGDVSPLAELVEIKRRYDALLMVDDAHGFGVLGATGRGIAEASGVRAGDVDLWMGTLSKALASVGGFVAGARDLIEWLRYSCPGFVFSAGMPPAVAAAALAAVELLHEEPWRVRALRDNALTLRELLGHSVGDSPIIPLITGSADGAIALSHALRVQGILAAPMLPPAVPEGQSRVRLFLSAMHTRAHLEELAGALSDVSA